MITKIISACKYVTPACLNFNKITKEIIRMVNDHYFDLQMYANFVFYIETEDEPLSLSNNIINRLKSVENEFGEDFPDIKMFDTNNMNDLEELVKQIFKKFKDNIIGYKDYIKTLDAIQFFGGGAVSSSVLLKANKIVQENKDNKEIIPIIIKLIPLNMPHHYNFVPMNQDSTLENRLEIIWKYIEAPAYSLFFKEAWMYCFSKNELSKYTPTFNCILGCYIIKGFPIKSLEQLITIYNVYRQKKFEDNKHISNKKWLDIVVGPVENSRVKEELMAADFGCFEMAEIEGIMGDLAEQPAGLDLGMIFEYLYTEVVAAFIGRIIFTDDHLENIAYIFVDHYRHYKIKCNGCNYDFYIPPGRMVQFIDLERYVFNFSSYDIYTNTALKNIPSDDYQLKSNHIDTIKKTYLENDFIFTKGIKYLTNREKVGKKNFRDPDEYTIMMEILTTPFVHDIRTFCQIMDTSLPQKYKEKPVEKKIIDYVLDLDDDKLRIIKLNDIYEEIKD